MDLEKIRRKIQERLNVVYDDDEITVVIGLSDQELKSILLDILSEAPMDSRRMHELFFDNLVSDDKIRRVLNELVREGKVIETKDHIFMVKKT